MTTQHTVNTNQKSQKLHPTILRLFEKRGWGPDEIKEFMSWDLKELPDLTQMQGMEDCTDRILDALANEEVIGIYGDYDVDGTTSCALFYHFFKMIGHEVKLIQPSRVV